MTAHTLYDYLVAARRAAEGDAHALDEYRAAPPPPRAAAAPKPPAPPPPPAQGGLGL